MQCYVLDVEGNKSDTIGALIIRIGFWGPLYYSYNEVSEEVCYCLQQLLKADPSLPLMLSLMRATGCKPKTREILDTRGTTR